MQTAGFVVSASKLDTVYKKNKYKEQSRLSQILS